MNFLYKRKPAQEEFDEDCLVDYDEKDIRDQKPKIYTKYKQTLDNLCSIEYTNDGLIKRPRCVIGSRTCHVPITQTVIESILLKQHCRITKEEDIRWFKDGIKWLAREHYQKYPNINQETIHIFEQACKAYFSIPLDLCENHWAASHILQQASKSNFFHRVSLLKRPSLHMKSSSFIKRYCCFCL
ncbi:hypothetical protein AB4K20DRAFT_1927198 [Rhizopus microsporus]|uniref:Uncharacterized protein n=1 Tax=Rhizopus microsporus TaxID=58291 RepID=A0A1X0RRG6_RHIZD|nr:hypothetical protein BCV71DRAFT_229146 [Rhizopus microsporus]